MVMCDGCGGVMSSSGTTYIRMATVRVCNGAKYQDVFDADLCESCREALVGAILPVCIAWQRDGYTGRKRNREEGITPWGGQ